MLSPKLLSLLMAKYSELLCPFMSRPVMMPGQHPFPARIRLQRISCQGPVCVAFNTGADEHDGRCVLAPGSQPIEYEKPLVKGEMSP